MLAAMAVSAAGKAAAPECSGSWDSPTYSATTGERRLGTRPRTSAESSKALAVTGSRSKRRGVPIGASGARCENSRRTSSSLSETTAGLGTTSAGTRTGSRASSTSFRAARCLRARAASIQAARRPGAAPLDAPSALSAGATAPSSARADFRRRSPAAERSARPGRFRSAPLTTWSRSSTRFERGGSPDSRHNRPNATPVGAREEGPRWQGSVISWAD